MDAVKLGRTIRALRRRHGWRQVDLAQRAGVSQSTVSLIECGQGATFTLEAISKVAGPLAASISYDMRWRGPELDRLLDERHASIVERLVRLLATRAWQAEVEISYSEWGERGSIDILAFHPNRRALLVVEVKTQLVSAESTLRKLDEKERLSREIARQRFGWEGAHVSRVLVLAESMTARRRLAEHSRLFDAVLPVRGHALRSWLRCPDRPIRGLWLFSGMNVHGISERRSGPARVRVARTIPARARGGRNEAPGGQATAPSVH